MSWIIKIQRAKPNPAGKDRNKYSPYVEQLLGEWVDLQNVGDQAVDLSILRLAHQEFGAYCTPKGGPSLYWHGAAGRLEPGRTLRVHTGRSRESARMKPEDWSGADLHSFAESENFVLNNDCGDTLTVLWQGTGATLNHEDAASYDRNPQEGKVLVRIGDKLI